MRPKSHAGRRGCRRTAARRRSSEARSSPRRFIRRWLLPSTLVSGIAALVWLLLRSGTKPSRVVYPCQQAAFATAAAAFGPHLVAVALLFRSHIVAASRSTAGRVAVGLLILATIAVLALGRIDLEGAGGGAALSPPPGYRPDVFLVNDARGPSARRHGGVDDLVELLGQHGFKWHASPAVTATSGPNGMIDTDDVVLIKINAQWPQRGGTNTDVLRGVIRRVVEHLDGFTGEVLVVDNGQGRGSVNHSQSNAEDIRQSSLDVAREFAQEGWTISAMLWDSIRGRSVREFSDGDASSGYVVNSALDPQTRIRVSYPKFRTAPGTFISYKHGVWSPESGTYDPDRLVVINIPVLKTHSTYGITASVKNHMGVVTKDLATDSHYAIGRGGLGSFLAEVRMPDITILDCIWIMAIPGAGPAASYGQTARRDQLLASTDPVVLDAWAAKFVMLPQVVAHGYSPSQYRSTLDPDNPNSLFRRYLDRSMQELLAAGIDATNDYEAVRLHVWTDGEPSFVRGDANQDGFVDISDPIRILFALFRGDGGLACEDSADANDDGGVEVSDALFDLNFVFLRGPAPPAPFPGPGSDPTADDLGCSAEFAAERVEP